MKDPLESSRNKIARAKHHIDDLDTRIGDFLEEHPYEIVIESDPEPGYKIHKARLSKPIPASLALIAGDAAGNLRAALDHIGYAIAVSSGLANPKHYHFPFASTRRKFKETAPGICKDLPKQIAACFYSFHPYRDGNEFLWALNAVRNEDAHMILTPTCIGDSNLTVRDSVSLRGGITDAIEAPANRFWDRSKNEIELLRTRGNPKYNVRLVLDVAFDGPEVLARQPMVTVLEGFVNEVERILMAVDKEARLLGLFP